jgi:hypothetical protein
VNVDNLWIEIWISNSRGSDKLKIMLLSVLSKGSENFSLFETVGK